MPLEDQLKVIKRGTLDILSEDELRRKLSQQSVLNIKFGIDPTAPDIHLGHTVPLQKLKQFQDMGHNIHLIIGDYTAKIGDPSGRSETRPMLSNEQIARNLETYTTQVFKILTPEKTTLLYNSDWLGAFSGEDLINLASKYTVQQMLQRRDFSKRIAENRPLSVAELFYPLLVGYDSVHLKTDVELGGSDQLFNFMASRDLQTAHGQVPEVVIILPLLEGLDGHKKMSKSLGNAIGVTEPAEDMYGKIMSVSDLLMVKYFELISDVGVAELEAIKSAVSTGSQNPMLYKKQLARELVTRYHGSDAAINAQNAFETVHQRKSLPEIVQGLDVHYSQNNDLSLVSVLRLSGRAKSNSEARRLIEQKSVRLNLEPVTNLDYRLSPEDGAVLQVGKNFARQLYFKHDG